MVIYIYIGVNSCSGRKRARRCGECSNCKRDDCGTCMYCSDMKKYRGPGKKKRCCLLRKCLQPTQSSHVLTNEDLAIKVDANPGITALAIHDQL